MDKLAGKAKQGRSAATGDLVVSAYAKNKTTSKRTVQQKHKAVAVIGLAQTGNKIKFAKHKATALYYASVPDRVEIIRQGIPAVSLPVIAHQMSIPQERLLSALRFPRSSIGKKIKANAPLSPEQSERVVGLERLIGQVQVMVEQSGNPKGFDASKWIGEWIERSLPALGGKKPADYMDTMDGQELVSKLLAQSQSGAYA